MWSFKIDMYITHDDNHGLLILFFLQSKKKKNKKIKKKKSFEDVQEEKHSGSESVEDGKKKKKKKKKVKKQKSSAESPTNSGSNLQVKGKKGRKIDGKIISASKVVDVGQMGLQEGGKPLKKKPAKKRKHETGEKKPLSLGTWNQWIYKSIYLKKKKKKIWWDQFRIVGSGHNFAYVMTAELS